MTKGITPYCKKRVFEFPKEVTRRLWLSAINTDADSFNPKHSVVANFILKQKISKQITLHVLALLEYGCVWNQKLYILFLWNICLNLSYEEKG